MSDPKIEVQIRAASKPGAVKVHADVTVLLPNGELHLIGFAVIEKNGKPPFVGFPALPGRNRYFPVVEARGRINEVLVSAILEAYREHRKAAA